MTTVLDLIFSLCLSIYLGIFVPFLLFPTKKLPAPQRKTSLLLQHLNLYYHRVTTLAHSR